MVLYSHLKQTKNRQKTWTTGIQGTEPKAMKGRDGKETTWAQSLPSLPLERAFSLWSGKGELKQSPRDVLIWVDKAEIGRVQGS